MATHIHSNRTGTATVVLDGVAKNPAWSVDDPSIVTAVAINTGDSDTFRAGLTPAPGATFGHETVLRFICDRLDGSGQITTSGTVDVVEGAATAVNSMTISEN